jgi:TldD protein
MKDLTRRALDKASELGASYADMRVVGREEETIHVKNGKVENLGAITDRGFGVRCIVDGCWGFASSSLVEPKEVDRVVDLAVQIAKASGRTKREDVVLADEDTHEGVFASQVKSDPFEVPLQDKISLLMDADKIMRAEPNIKVSEAEMLSFRQRSVFASSEGSYIDETKTESGAGITATAVDGEELQRRSHPQSFGGDYATAGYEYVESCKLVENAERVAKEANELLKAEQCPSDERTLILGKSMLALQVHESCGHPIELDRVFGTEASYAGTSFLTTDKLGKFRYGSDKVNIVADATAPGGLGSFFFDDEGVKAQKVPIVDKGMFVGYLTSRETAPKIGWDRSGGAMRADGWSRIPLIRMTNINLLPGDSSFDEMVAETKNGIYVDGIASWSIDDKRLNFQFGCEYAREVKDGSLGKVYKSPTYTGITYEFWGSCDLIAGKKEWHLWGVPNCGKGEPGQSAHVGHGVSFARFPKVRVGVMK